MALESTGATPDPVEPAEATAAEETETPSPEPEGEPGEQPGEKPKKSGIERRFSELTGRAKAAEQYAQRLEEMNRQLMERIGQPARQEEPEKPVPLTRPKPTRESVEYDEDRYIEAVADWKAEQREAQVLRRMEEQRRQAVQQHQQTALVSSLREVDKKGVAKYGEEFREVAFIPEPIAHIVAQAENAEDLAFYLGKNPEARQELVALAQQNPYLVAYRVGQMAVKAATPPKSATKAPAPINPVGGAGQAEKNPDSMSTAEWIAWRNKQVERR